MACPVPQSDQQRAAALWSRVDTSGGPNCCWPWTKYRDRDGYGRFRFQGKVRQATRVVFYLEHGRWPTGFMCHRCDNPPCCNPRHLYDGSRSDNAHDFYERGTRTWIPPRGSAHWSSKLSASKAMDIRRRRQQGVSRASLCVEFGVSRATIARVINGQAWS